MFTKINFLMPELAAIASGEKPLFELFGLEGDPEHFTLFATGRAEGLPKPMGVCNHIGAILPALEARLAAADKCPQCGGRELEWDAPEAGREGIFRVGECLECEIAISQDFISTLVQRATDEDASL